MDRTADFHSIVSIFLQDRPGADGAASSSSSAIAPVRPKPGSSAFLLQAVTVFEHLRHNEELVQDMNRLATKKEFSNDPTKNMEELASVFQSRVSWIQDNIKKLKSDSESGREGSHLQQHNKLIVQHLSKSITTQISSFKAALKEHGRHVAERTKRVQQYGVATESLDTIQSKPVVTAGAVGKPQQGDSESKYAMFANRNAFAGRLGMAPARSRDDPAAAEVGFKAPTGLHQRAPGRAPGPSVIAGGAADARLGRGSGVPFHPMQAAQEQQQQVRRKDDYRLRAAEKVESSIRQMGELFSQMASMVAEQGEVITRIEDDVEEGLANTVEAHASIQKVYDITKGNRSMILKVFALLVFFIFLFLVWT